MRLEDVQFLAGDANIMENDSLLGISIRTPLKLYWAKSYLVSAACHQQVLGGRAECDRKDFGIVSFDFHPGVNRCSCVPAAAKFEKLDQVLEVDMRLGCSQHEQFVVTNACKKILVSSVPIHILRYYQ